MTLVTDSEWEALASLERLPVTASNPEGHNQFTARAKSHIPTPLTAVVHRELLARRIVDAVKAKAKPAPVSSGNQQHAAFAVLRAARLVAVGNGLAEKYTARLSLLEQQLAKDILSHASGFGEGSLPSLFTEYDREASSTFDWLQGEAQDDFLTLAQILQGHTGVAMSLHQGALEPRRPIDSLPLVLGAPIADHLEKMKSDLLFRLKAETRKAVAVGSTAAETVARLGMKQKVQASQSIRAADPLAAISIGIRLFDNTDNSFWKFVQAAVTALASDTDQESFDDADEEKRMGFVWVSAADAKVCEYCEAMDGQQWDANKEPVGDAPELEQEPPAHFNCRCALIPCDLDAEMPQGSFQSYLAHFSDEEQKQAFGEKAVAAYRRGELTPAQLMGQESHSVSLESFRDMEPQLELNEAKYSRMGEASGEAANRRTLERRIRSVLFGKPPEKITALEYREALAVLAADWDPQQHPRDENGRFTDGNSESMAMDFPPRDHNKMFRGAMTTRDDMGAYLQKRMRVAKMKLLGSHDETGSDNVTTRYYHVRLEDGRETMLTADQVKQAAIERAARIVQEPPPVEKIKVPEEKKFALTWPDVKDE